MLPRRVFYRTAVGVGDLTVDQTLANAANTLYSTLAANGPISIAFGECYDFQNAYNAAGGSPPLTVDGYYGTATASALDTVLNASGNPSQAPTASAAVAGSGGSDPLPANFGSGGVVQIPEQTIYGTPPAPGGSSTNAITTPNTNVTKPVPPGPPATALASVNILGMQVPTWGLLLIGAAALAAGIYYEGKHKMVSRGTRRLARRAVGRRGRRAIRRRR